MTGLCLHIGCGLIIAENWYNIDASPTLRLSKLPIFGPMMAKTLKLPHWSSNAHYGNIVKGLNLKSNSCDLIYASHVLEHLTLTDFHTAMDHIYSYLKPGGVFRAIVPDLGNLIATYIKEQQDPELAIQAAGNLMQNSLMGHLGSRKSLLSRLKESLATIVINGCGTPLR
ncbi:methyltransferase domain-containing protein [Spirulina sp. CS-785/01]|uniref:class I SAM-dependent methyltransferase n=1 Tax=Spirulina sp. CS-785/01 TaxID=3021716 RepID=UPI00232AF69A|nr:methyltransferase domain-containing protein [Spirulina sp. CS-785/01]MDB9312600.1 methyltransferase domain-containing protein [Spirulina sp. CS-785/01]